MSSIAIILPTNRFMTDVNWVVLLLWWRSLFLRETFYTFLGILVSRVISLAFTYPTYIDNPKVEDRFFNRRPWMVVCSPRGRFPCFKKTKRMWIGGDLDLSPPQVKWQSMELDPDPAGPCHVGFWTQAGKLCWCAFRNNSLWFVVFINHDLNEMVIRMNWKSEMHN